MPYKDKEKNKDYQKGYREKNRKKAKDTAQKWYHSDRGRNKVLLYNYNITLEQYNDMLKNQNYLCAICKQPEKMLHKGNLKKLCVDHCHTTGKVRGLLCHRCNTVLGHCEDDKVILQNLIHYLESVL